MSKKGYQLSSLTPYLNTPENLIKSFQKLYEIGYRYVQLQGVSEDIQDAYIAKALAETGLKCLATQEDYPLGFGDDPERAIARALYCDAKYLTCALIPHEVNSMSRLRRFANKLSLIAEKVHAAGLVFAFHPIAPDFRYMGSKPVFLHLMDMLPQNVQLTFCVHSAFSAKANPMPIFDAFKGRMDLVHFKDDTLLLDGSTHLVPLGQGLHDWQPILKACRQAGVRYVFAEQEHWLKDAYDSAKDSHDYLVSLGL